MDVQQQAPSNETNAPSPVNLCSPATADGKHTNALILGIPNSFAPQPVSNLARWSAQDLKVGADQGITVVQKSYGVCLQKGEGVGIDFERAAHYLKLAAGQGNPQAKQKEKGKEKQKQKQKKKQRQKQKQKEKEKQRAKQKENENEKEKQRKRQKEEWKRKEKPKQKPTQK
jgi:TPR repeat protein